MQNHLLAMDMTMDVDRGCDVRTQLPQEVQEHLATCDTCQGMYGEISDLFEAWQRPPAPSSDRVLQVMQRLLQEEKLADSVRTRGGEGVVHRHEGGAWKRTLFHYGVAASLAFVLLNVGFFQHLRTGLTTADAQINGYMVGWVQYLSHESF